MRWREKANVRPYASTPVRTHESYIARPVKTSFLGKGLSSGITALGTRAAASSSRATCAADSLNLRGRMLDSSCRMLRAPGIFSTPICR